MELGQLEFETGQLVDLPPRELSGSLDPLVDAARLAAKLGMRIGLAGRLDERSVGTFLEAAPGAAWISVGREWIARSLLVGMEQATRDYRARL